MLANNVHLHNGMERDGEMSGIHSRKETGLIIGRKIVSIRDMKELRFLHKLQGAKSHLTSS
jgi:hypothetical protein